MEAEASAPPGRPRPWLLGVLALAVVLALVSWLAPGKSAAPAPGPSIPRTPASAKTVETVEPGDLDVRLGELKQPRPGTESSERNPFRFYVKPAPPPPVVPKGEGNGRGGPPPPPIAPVPAEPPGPPPIPLKYIGDLEVPGVGKVAAFSDCRSTMRGREGEIIAGQYRLVRIGVESVVMEYVDGRGRITIRKSGQECVGK
jgi:hypothetical protein